MTVENARAKLAASISEQDFQQQVIELAKLTGWLVHAERPAINRHGRWSTPIQGDPGWPDLTLAHPDGLVVIAELKREREGPTPEQDAWLHAMHGAGLYSTLWRPSDWDYIERLLRTRRT